MLELAAMALLFLQSVRLVECSSVQLKGERRLDKLVWLCLPQSVVQVR